VQKLYPELRNHLYSGFLTDGKMKGETLCVLTLCVLAVNKKLPEYCKWKLHLILAFSKGELEFFLGKFFSRSLGNQILNAFAT
jgi:hypothetical protein